MPRRPVRNVFLLGVVVGLLVALVRAWGRTPQPAPARPLATPAAPLPAVTPPEPVVVPDPEPADAEVVEVVEVVEAVVEVEVPLAETPHAPVTTDAPVVDAPASAGGAWVEPVDGACPDGYPIKLKLSSGIFHRPGGLSYERTVPDRCYVDEAAAEADGYRAAKR